MSSRRLRMTCRVWRVQCDGVRPSPLADTSRDSGDLFGGSDTSTGAECLGAGRSSRLTRLAEGSEERQRERRMAEVCRRCRRQSVKIGLRNRNAGGECKGAVAFRFGRLATHDSEDGNVSLSSARRAGAGQRGDRQGLRIS